jgi:hypothetical protein
MAKKRTTSSRIPGPAKAGRRGRPGNKPGSNKANMPTLAQMGYAPATPIDAVTFVVSGQQPELTRMFMQAQERLRRPNLCVRAA